MHIKSQVAFTKEGFHLHFMLLVSLQAIYWDYKPIWTKDHPHGPVNNMLLYIGTNAHWNISLQITSISMNGSSYYRNIHDYVKWMTHMYIYLVLLICIWHTQLQFRTYISYVTLDQCYRLLAISKDTQKHLQRSTLKSRTPRLFPSSQIPFAECFLCKLLHQ